MGLPNDRIRIAIARSVGVRNARLTKAIVNGSPNPAERSRVGLRGC